MEDWSRGSDGVPARLVVSQESHWTTRIEVRMEQLREIDQREYAQSTWHIVALNYWDSSRLMTALYLVALDFSLPLQYRFGMGCKRP